jgi:hypothetical protein
MQNVFLQNYAEELLESGVEQDEIEQDADYKKA